MGGGGGQPAGAHQVAAQLASFNDTAAKLRPLRGQLNAVTAVASAAGEAAEPAVPAPGSAADAAFDPFSELDYMFAVPALVTVDVAAAAAAASGPPDSASADISVESSPVEAVPVAAVADDSAAALAAVSVPDAGANCPAANGLAAAPPADAAPPPQRTPVELEAFVAAISLGLSPGAEGRAHRKEMWAGWDGNGNGVLSLAEVRTTVAAKRFLPRGSSRRNELTKGVGLCLAFGCLLRVWY